MFHSLLHWFRRKRIWVVVILASMVLIASGMALVDQLHRVRVSAWRMNDL